MHNCTFSLLLYTISHPFILNQRQRTMIYPPVHVSQQSYSYMEREREKGEFLSLFLFFFFSQKSIFSCTRHFASKLVRCTRIHGLILGKAKDHVRRERDIIQIKRRVSLYESLSHSKITCSYIVLYIYVGIQRIIQKTEIMSLTPLWSLPLV